MTKLDPAIANHHQFRLGARFHVGRRAQNLEQQVLLPIQSAGEMNMPIEQLRALASITEYRLLFASTSPKEA